MSALDVFHILVGLILAGLTIHTLLNHRTLWRLERMAGLSPLTSISVLIPARNEARRIEPCLRAWLGQRYPHYEVLVYDDDSTDDTAIRVAALAASARNLRLIRGRPLAPGWRGKPHACHGLRAAAHGELLVFADVDILPASTTLASTAGALSALAADVLSAVPRHASDSPAVRALVALQNWAALVFVPSWLPPFPRLASLAAVNGQFLALRAAVYDATGGFTAVRSSLAEDSELGRRLQALGYRVRLVDGAGVLTSVPYRRVRECWSANVRNLTGIFFGSPVLLLTALAALATVYLGPPVVLTLGLLTGRAGNIHYTWMPLGELALGMFGRLLADRRAGYATWLTLLHPIAIAVLVAMGVESAARFCLGRGVAWAGRRYDIRDDVA
jgi:cellulose synthase/poly-beta-1,6-N-acetylglucosamine synthase-like glycosyltransferase